MAVAEFVEFPNHMLNVVSKGTEYYLEVPPHFLQEGQHPEKGRYNVVHALTVTSPDHLFVLADFVLLLGFVATHVLFLFFFLWGRSRLP